MSTTAVDDAGGESSWGSFFDSLGKATQTVANTAAKAYAKSAGLNDNPAKSANPDDYRQSQRRAQQPDGSPIYRGSSLLNSPYVMYGVIGLFALVVLILLVKVL